MSASPEGATPTQAESVSGSSGSPSAASPHAATAGAGQSIGPRRRVLLVDDEECIIASLRRLLRREGYDLVAAKSGAEALTLLEAEPVDLVVSDQRMPGMTGVELLHIVRERWPDTMRIILSGYSEASTIIAAVNEGKIYKFLAKPWNDEELKLHIRRALERHELEAENRRMARAIAAQNDRLRHLNARLEQRAADASAGLTSTQSLLEAIDVGLISVDRAGLIVGANRRAHDFVLSTDGGMVGVAAHAALPTALHELLCRATAQPPSTTCGHVALGNRQLQFRISPLDGEDGRRGTAIALWEEVV